MDLLLLLYGVLMYVSKLFRWKYQVSAESNYIFLTQKLSQHHNSLNLWGFSCETENRFPEQRHELLPGPEVQKVTSKLFLVLSRKSFHNIWDTAFQTKLSFCKSAHSQPPTNSIRGGLLLNLLAQHQQKEQKITHGWKCFWNTQKTLKHLLLTYELL